MAAAIRLSRQHLGLTAENPSVAAIVVKDGVIVGSGVTAFGGRPHAETQALIDAGKYARGATVYVTLEPCAHYGATPPCANALVAAGIARVVIAADDPDARVGGRGCAILQAAGIEVTSGILAEEAAAEMAGYLTRSVNGRPQVTLKLALSKDGYLGLPGQEIGITGEISRRQVHLMRAEAGAILVGIGTVMADDPELTCRLPGLERRSPRRIILDPKLQLPLDSKLATSARQVPVIAVTDPSVDAVRAVALEALGVRLFRAGGLPDGPALRAVLKMLAADKITDLMVEGGAATAQAFLDADFVDRLVLFEGPAELGSEGIKSPVTPATILSGFTLIREDRFGSDICREWIRKD